VLTGPIAAAVFSRVTNTVSTPLAPDDRAEWKEVAVDMLSPRRDRQHSLPMFVAAPATLLAHPRVAILLATHGGRPTLDEAVLEWMDGSCAFRSAPGAVLENNQTLDLFKDAACRADETAAANLRLTVRVKERAHRVAVWAYQPAPGPQPPDLIRIWEGDPGTYPAGIVRGTYFERGGRPRRIALLNYVWNIAADSTWIWVTLVVAGALTALSVVLLTRTTDEPAPRWKANATIALACASLAFALGILYVTFVPPFEAPDEPAHLMAFADITGRTGMVQSAETLAKRGHLQRLRFHGDERFRPGDVGRPWPVAWTSEVFAHDVEGRSLTTFWWWKATGGLTRGLTTPRTLLTARLANALAFALTIGAASLLFAAAAPPGATRSVLPIVLLLVPTLPFFATHLSEFALLTDAYILLAASIGVLLADGPMVHRVGFPLGASIALALLSGRSAAPILPLFAALLAARVVLGQRDGTPRRTAIFWASCGAGLALFPAFVSEAFSRGLWPGDTQVTIAGWFRQAAELLRAHPAYLLVPIPIGYACESLLARMRSAPPSAAARIGARLVGYGLVAMVFVSLAGSLLFDYPTLATRETVVPASAADYTARVLAVALTSLRLTGPDLLTSSFFWGGFGWVDTVLPNGVVIALSAVVALGVMLSGWSVARRQDGRHALWIVLLAAGGTAALAAYAVSNYFVNRNLHGRYLVGVYAAALLAAWTIPLLRGPQPSERVRPLLLAAVIGIHAFALPFVLLRYF
jgi:hypothetical protein